MLFGVEVGNHSGSGDERFAPRVFHALLPAGRREKLTRGVGDKDVHSAREASINKSRGDAVDIVGEARVPSLECGSRESLPVPLVHALKPVGDRNPCLRVYVRPSV
eukprot:scaffold97867_cov33-Prasinocladus_malaysianus.AAC.1